MNEQKSIKNNLFTEEQYLSFMDSQRKNTIPFTIVQPTATEQTNLNAILHRDFLMLYNDRVPREQLVNFLSQSYLYDSLVRTVIEIFYQRKNAEERRYTPVENLIESNLEEICLQLFIAKSTENNYLRQATLDNYLARQPVFTGIDLAGSGGDFSISASDFIKEVKPQ
jgi:hypothetical protein